MNYHCHIYFDLIDTPVLEDLRRRCLKELPELRFFKIYPQKVGPHAKPMMEMHFDGSKKDKILSWLSTHRAHLSLLIHQETGDDFRDHQTQNIIWMGEVLPIDFHFFELVKKEPEHSLH